jgi:hypothetical protein
VFVALLVTLPLSPSEFNVAKEQGFRIAVATSCRVTVGHVVVYSVSQVRRSSGSSIRVNSRIATDNQASASLMTSLLTMSSLNRDLAAQGLPECTTLNAAIEDPPVETTQVSTIAVVGLSLGGSILLLGCLRYIVMQAAQKTHTEEERMLIGKMAELRKRFKISRDDGFLLSSEDAPWLVWRSGGYIVVKRDYLEAAARLALLLDFDLLKFDGLCLSLECLNDPSPKRLPGALFAGAPPGPCAGFVALQEFLLEISKELIRPTQVTHANGEPALDFVARLTSEQRFKYLQKVVLRARIWLEDGGALFERLKAAAQEFMEDIAQLCDKRFSELRMEASGEQLLTFQVEQERLAAGYICRQDHDEVCPVQNPH